MREVLATEMLEALGVNTSKTFALFETGEALERGDEPSPTRSSVLTRLSHGHIRIGTFQRLAFFGEAENIAKLDPLLPRAPLRRAAGDDDAENALRLFDLVSQATATLAASYLAAGFVHGVLNSDNINVTGESFDYGPWRFTPEWDPDVHRRLFRPLRALRLRPAARGDPLGPRPVRRLPQARHRIPAAGRNARRLGRAVRGGVDGRDARRLGVAPAKTKGTESSPRALIAALADSRGDDRPHLLRLARRPRSRRGDLSVRTFRALAQKLEGRERAPNASLLVR